MLGPLMVCDRATDRDRVREEAYGKLELLNAIGAAKKAQKRVVIIAVPWQCGSLEVVQIGYEVCLGCRLATAGNQTS